MENKIDFDSLPEIPDNSKRIWLARVFVEIIRIKYNKKIRDKFSTLCVYKDDAEHDESSYFFKTLRHELKLEKFDEQLKITEIQKIKYIGFSIPETNE